MADEENKNIELEEKAAKPAVEEDTKPKKRRIKSPVVRLIFSNALKQSDEERNLQIDMLRFRNNSFATTVGYIGMIAMIVSFCFLYSNTRVIMTQNVAIFGINHAGLWCGVDVFVNIAMMLFTFLTISRMKVYDRNWAIVGIGLGVFQVVRIFLYPTALHNANATATTTVLPDWLFTMQIICYIIFGACLIISGIFTIILSRILSNYLAELNEKEAH